MNPNPSSDGVPPTPDLRALNGKVVLVKSSRDHRTPPTAMRGSIEVRERSGSDPEVAIAVEFPQMFTSRAHHRTIPLDRHALEQLLASECNGTYEFTIDEELR